jgi:hypothetical protein
LAFFANLNVLRLSLNDSTAGEIQNNIKQFESPFSERSSSFVSLESL